ncbi:MAG: hypothetical protein H7317_17600 [Pseudorhodobacter sp.]|nr:hypothetical protein [Pseudorhodobacter sp.]
MTIVWKMSATRSIRSCGGAATDVASTTCHTVANDFSQFTCHEHQEADLIRKHWEEGIRYIDNCVACHRDAHAEGGEGGEGVERDDD